MPRRVNPLATEEANIPSFAQRPGFDPWSIPWSGNRAQALLGWSPSVTAKPGRLRFPVLHEAQVRAPVWQSSLDPTMSDPGVDIKPRHRSDAGPLSSNNRAAHNT